MSHRGSFPYRTPRFPDVRAFQENILRVNKHIVPWSCKVPYMPARGAAGLRKYLKVPRFDIVV